MTASAQEKVGYWLACRAASHICALPMSGIVETMRPLPVEAFPHAPAFVSGIAIIRGAPTPVVDMCALIGEPSSAPARHVTVRVNNRVVALAFDDVLGVYGLRSMDAVDLPPLLKNVAGETISQVTTRDAALLLFFEAARIFPPGLIETLGAERTAG